MLYKCMKLDVSVIWSQVLEIEAKRRTGPENFVSSMRKTVAGRYGAEPVAMGGVFQIKAGHAKLHVMVCYIIQCQAEVSKVEINP